MARPIVLVATTNYVMAYALQERLKGECKVLGLKLDVCPDGDEYKVGDENVRAYDSAEALFDALDRFDPMELADTMVVLDVGTELDNAFRPAASEDQRWHVTKKRAGVAVELLLRYPQVFPIFLSPSVPVTEDEAKKAAETKGGGKDRVVEPTWRSTAKGEWRGFCQLREELCTKHKHEDEKPDLVACESLYAFRVPLHFVSPLDNGDGMVSTLARFARGMRCWFDPTGLRTLVKNRFLGTIFGSNDDWGDTDLQRAALLDRLKNVCVAIDEEHEFTLLNAYTAWKFGRRSWVVTTFGEFDDSPLWVNNAVGDSRDVVVLRDVDLRFPDVPDTDAPELGIQNGKSPRALLMDICSCLWNTKETRNCTKGGNTSPGNKIGEAWRVCAVSSMVSDNTKLKVLRNNKTGQRVKNNKIEYLGFKKPIGTIYDLKPFLFTESDDKKKQNSTNTQAGAVGSKGNQDDKEEQKSIAARIKAAPSEGSKGGHGAPYSNLAMAEALLKSSLRCNVDPSAHLIGALLAMESYELLLGMSKTTALEALLALHKHEAAAEVSFPGISHSLETKERKKDIKQTLDALYARGAKSKEQVKRMFLSQFWAELRIQYKNGEQFDAAEEANVQSLLNMKWLKWLSECSPLQCIKYLILRISTSLVWWFLGAFVSSLMFTVLYAIVYKYTFLPSPHGLETFFRIWYQVILAMIEVQRIEPLSNDIPHNLIARIFDPTLTILHLGVSYVLFGILIAMIYRKITRG